MPICASIRSRIRAMSPSGASISRTRGVCASSGKNELASASRTMGGTVGVIAAVMLAASSGSTVRRANG